MAKVTAWVGQNFGTGSRRRVPTYIVLALSVGAISALLVPVPQIRSLEQDLGLGWLFRWRGPLAAPQEVVIVTMSRESAGNIFLPQDPEKFHHCDDIRTGAKPATHVSVPSLPARWPRCLHTMLVDKLVKAGATTVAFDVLFRTRPALPGRSGDLNADQDRLLAAAMSRARRVLIAGKLESADISPASPSEEMIEISPVILDAALGIAPFPVVAHDGRLDEFLVFTQGSSATPSLPALALQAYSLDVYPQFRDMLARLAPDQVQLMPSTAEEVRTLRQLQTTCLLIRQIFAGTPGLARRMQTALASDESAGLDADVRAGLSRLVALYSGPDVRLLNLFGPSGTVRAYGYDQALAFDDKQSTAAFLGKMVFVGYAEIHRPEQMEHFATVFSSANGLALSGVEIAATAFANFLSDSSIRPAALPLWVLITLLAGITSTLLCLFLPSRLALPMIGLLVASYVGAALGVFIGRHIWLPLVTPACIAAPLGLITGMAWKYRVARQQRDYIRNAFIKFVPREVVDELEKNAGNLGATRESLECACVATDAANYTNLAEAMQSEELADFLNRYFDTLFRPVARHGGFVSDIVGDAMLAIWPGRSTDTREHMLTALLEMREAAMQFNEQATSNRLTTRFGVDWGRVTLTMVGSQTHYEYRAVGDTANTATRIQELNKKLGTRVLVSEPALEGVETFLLRDVGYFLLRGKALPVHAFELIGPRKSAHPEDLELCERFAGALALLRTGASAAALEAFRKLAAGFPGDGPAAFYVRALKSGIALRNGALKVD